MPEKGPKSPGEIPRGVAKTKPRFDRRGEIIQVPIGEDFEKQLERLRRLSQRINQRLQERYDEEDLPYSSRGRSRKKTEIFYPKILRLSVQLRPEFFESDETKTQRSRYTVADDEVTLFIHLTPENKIQTLRTHLGPKGASDTVNFVSSWTSYFYSLQQEDRVSIERSAESGDIEPLVEILIQSLRPVPIRSFQPEHGATEFEGRTFHQMSTTFFQEAYQVSDIHEASAYFDADPSFIFYQSPEVLQNLAKVVVMSVLETNTKELIKQKKSAPEIRALLQTESTILGRISIRTFLNKEGKIASYIPNWSEYVSVTIRTIIAHYKPAIMGWRKK